MEEKTGCVQRAVETRKAVREILDAANKLITYQDKAVSVLAAQIVEAAQRLEE